MSTAEPGSTSASVAGSDRITSPSVDVRARFLQGGAEGEIRCAQLRLGLRHGEALEGRHHHGVGFHCHRDRDGGSSRDLLVAAGVLSHDRAGLGLVGVDLTTADIDLEPELLELGLGRGLCLADDVRHDHGHGAAVVVAREAVDEQVAATGEQSEQQKADQDAQPDLPA